MYKGVEKNTDTLGARSTRATHHAARRALHRPLRALVRLPLPPPPPRAPLLPPVAVRPPPPAGSPRRPAPRRAAARRPGAARRPRGAGPQVRPRYVPPDGHLRRDGGVVAGGGAHVPQGAGLTVREPPRRGQRRGHHIRVPEHGVRQLRAQVEADAEAVERAPARGARARRLGGRPPRRGRPRPARHGRRRRRRPPRHRAGGARVRARQHCRPDHRQQAGVRRPGRRVQQLQGHDRVSAHRHGAVQHQRLRAGAGVAGSAGRAGEAAADSHPVRRPHHQAAGGARRHRRRPRARRPPGLRRQAPRQQGRRRGRRDHHRGQHQGPHLRHVHGGHGHVVDHRGVGAGGDDEEPVDHGARAGGAGRRRRARPPPGGAGPGGAPLPAGRVQGGDAAAPVHAAQPPALLLRRVRGGRPPRPGQHAPPHQRLGHRPRPVGVGGAARVPPGALPARRPGSRGRPAREPLRAHPLRRRPPDLRREARRHGLRAVLPGLPRARLRLAAAGRRGEAGHGRDLRTRAAQGCAAPRRRHAAPRAGRLRVSELRPRAWTLDVKNGWFDVASRFAA